MYMLRHELVLYFKDTYFIWFWSHLKCTLLPSYQLTLTMKKFGHIAESSASDQGKSYSVSVCRSNRTCSQFIGRVLLCVCPSVFLLCSVVFVSCCCCIKTTSCCSVFVLLVASVINTDNLLTVLSGKTFSLILFPTAIARVIFNVGTPHTVTKQRRTSDA